jgi:phosphonate transport system ATP-binding protein
MIEVAGLRVVFPPAVIAVDGIDLVVRSGEFVVVLGRSGSGKTTFARALAQAPAVVLADEPTASLDPALTSDIMGTLKAINARGLTLIVSQHQLETARAYATRIVGFRRGRVAFDGPPAGVTPAVVDAIYDG